MRRLRFIVVCLVLGTIVNVLVAWGLTINAGARNIRTGHFEATNIESGVNWPRRVSGLRVVLPNTVTGYSTSSGGFRSITGHSTRYAKWFEWIRAGWPMPALHARLTIDATPQLAPGAGGRRALRMVPSTRLDGAISSAFGWSGSTGRKRVLPIRPVFPGFLWNTLLYGAVLWLPFVTTSAVRHMKRRRRGACLACGYGLAGLERCPECGEQP